MMQRPAAVLWHMSVQASSSTSVQHNEPVTRTWGMCYSRNSLTVAPDSITLPLPPLPHTLQVCISPSSSSTSIQRLVD